MMPGARPRTHVWGLRPCYVSTVIKCIMPESAASPPARRVAGGVATAPAPSQQHTHTHTHTMPARTSQHRQSARLSPAGLGDCRAGPWGGGGGMLYGDLGSCVCARVGLGPSGRETFPRGPATRTGGPRLLRPTAPRPRRVSAQILTHTRLALIPRGKKAGILRRG